MASYKLLHGDCTEVLNTLEDESVQTCITSPPYYNLRDYGIAGQIGLEATPQSYVDRMIEVFRHVKRVLKHDGTLWLNLGDSYANLGVKDPSKVGGFTGERIRKRLAGINPNDAAQDSRPRIMPPGLKPKDLIGIPWRVAFALQSDGWYLRSDIIWHKPNPMPESCKDRPTKAHEYLFLLAKSDRYYYDGEAIKEPSVSPHDYPTRNRRSVWTVATKPYKGAHFATFPPKLIEPCILAGSRAGDIVLDPFNGAGTTGIVALQHGRDYVGIDLNPDYLAMSQDRLKAA